MWLKKRPVAWQVIWQGLGVSGDDKGLKYWPRPKHPLQCTSAPRVLLVDGPLGRVDG